MRAVVGDVDMTDKPVTATAAQRAEEAIRAGGGVPITDADLDAATEPLPPTPDCEPGLYCPFTDNGAYHGVCLWHKGPERTCTCDGRTTHQPATAVCPACGHTDPHDVPPIQLCRSCPCDGATPTASTYKPGQVIEYCTTAVVVKVEKNGYLIVDDGSGEFPVRPSDVIRVVIT